MFKLILNRLLKKHKEIPFEEKYKSIIDVKYQKFFEEMLPDMNEYQIAILFSILKVLNRHESFQYVKKLLDREITILENCELTKDTELERKIILHLVKNLHNDGNAFVEYYLNQE